MSILVIVFGVSIILVSIYFAIRPASMAHLAARLLRGKNLYLVAMVRVLGGSVLLAAAPLSRFPLAIEVLGWIAVTAGLLLLVFPPPLLARIVAFYERIPLWGMYLMLPLSLAFGGFLVFSFT